MNIDYVKFYFVLFATVCCFDTRAEQLEFELDRYAPQAEDLAQWIDNYHLVIEMGQTPEHLNRAFSEEDRAVAKALEVACEMQLLASCLMHIKTNRFAILQALPTNPMYWSKFWQVVELPNFSHLSHENDDLTNGMRRLIQNANWWYYRTLAMNGEVDTDKLLSMQAALNRWRSGHQTLIHRMYAWAIQGIAFNQLSHAMAQAGRSRNSELLRALSAASRPLSLASMAWGPVVWMEREAALDNLERFDSDAPLTEEELQQALVNVPLESQARSLELLYADKKHFLKNDYDNLALQVIPNSTIPWPEYWLNGLPQIQLGHESLSLLAIGASAYNQYVTAERNVNFRMHLFAALADIYSGAVSPGPPARPAPESWRWEWVEGERQRVCLIGDDIHPSTRETNMEIERWCVDFYSDEDIEVLLVE
ncbi:MAG: hypothetical protein AAF541_21645 [Pseudomonadota bacterium]